MSVITTPNPPRAYENVNIKYSNPQINVENNNDYYLKNTMGQKVSSVFKHIYNTNSASSLLATGDDPKSTYYNENINYPSSFLILNQEIANIGNPGDLLIGNGGGSNDFLNSINGKTGKTKHQFKSLDIVDTFICMSLTKGLSTISKIPSGSLVATTNPYEDKNTVGNNPQVNPGDHIVVYDSSNNYNSTVYSLNSGGRFAFMNTDNTGTIYIIKNGYPSYYFGYLNNFVPGTGTGTVDFQGVEIEGFTDFTGCITSGNTISSFMFDNENNLLFNFVFNNFYQIYKFKYDISKSKFVPYDADRKGLLIDYTEYITDLNIHYGTFSIVQDDNSNYYISIPNYLNNNGDRIHVNYTILQYNKNGKIINPNFIFIDLTQQEGEIIEDPMSFNVYNNNTFFFAIPRLGSSRLGSIYKTEIPVVNTFEFFNSFLYGGINIFTIYNATLQEDITTFHIDAGAICFKEGTKILCRLSDKEDIYVPIERITDNTYVKTWKHGYRRVKYILQSQIYNSSVRTINKLFRMSKNKYPELTEDLYITGSHAILRDSLTDWEQWKMETLQEKFNIDYTLTIDGKNKLIAYFDDRFEEYNEEGLVTIYHLVLESKTKDRNYGIYANGILVESTDEITMSRSNHYSLVNQGYKLAEEGNLMNIGINPNKINCAIDVKLDTYRKKAFYKEEDIIKKKVRLALEQEKKDTVEKETVEKEKSCTQKRYKPIHNKKTYNKTAQITLKKWI
jgi:hypothetical protein